MDNDFTYNLKSWANEVAQSVHGSGDPSQAMGIIYNRDHSLWSQYISCFKDYCFCVSKSYTVSTGLDFGHPDRMVLNVDRSIDVTVMGCVALWTSPLSYREWQVIHHIPASRTCFAQWEESVQWDHIPAIPVCFVGQLSDELEPATVSYGPCQCLVLHHILHALWLGFRG